MFFITKTMLNRLNVGGTIVSPSRKLIYPPPQAGIALTPGLYSARDQTAFFKKPTSVKIALNAITKSSVSARVEYSGRRQTIIERIGQGVCGLQGPQVKFVIENNSICIRSAKE